MKRIILFVVALVFVFCTTAMAARPMAKGAARAHVKTADQEVAPEKAKVKGKIKAKGKTAATVTHGGGGDPTGPVSHGGGGEPTSPATHGGGGTPTSPAAK